jgi:hypothetical protein
LLQGNSKRMQVHRKLHVNILQYLLLHEYSNSKKYSRKYNVNNSHANVTINVKNLWLSQRSR